MRAVPEATLPSTPCLSSHLYTVTDSEVPADTDLSAKATPLSHCRGASQANLRSHHSMLTDLTVVSYLNEIIQLDPHDG